MTRQNIKTQFDLDVYTLAFDTSMKIFDLTKDFPKDETYALVNQIRRSSRSVCANLAEAWRKRRYQAAFVSKLTDCEAEAAETQVWLQYSVACGYLPRETGRQLFAEYDNIIGKLTRMSQNPQNWLI
jgi:four helix bundle protein